MSEMNKNLKALYILRAKKFRTKKRLGQNFLIDPEIINCITSNVNKDDVILEIGPGVGFVTEKLVDLASKVIAVELDEDAIKVLEKTLGEKENFTLIHADILKTDLIDIFKEEQSKGKKIKVVANIPYYITSPIIAHLLGEIDEIYNKNRSMIDEIILMVQYEVAKRMVANNNSANKEYGMLSILSQFWADCSIIKFVSKRCFYPSPKVDSAILKIKINNNPRCEITPLLKRTIKASFSARRKNIKNSLLNAGFLNVEHALFECGFDFQIRGEKLSIEDFSKLSKALESAQNVRHTEEQYITPIKIDIDSVPNFDKINQLKDWILENLPLLGVIEIKANGRKVQFNKTAINRSLEGVQRDEVKQNSYFQLKEIVESSVFVQIRQADKKHENKVLGQELYYNVLEYDNKFYCVQISIDIPKTNNAPYVYAGHNVKIIEAASAASEVSPENGLTFVSPNTANISITDIKHLFNP